MSNLTSRTLVKVSRWRERGPVNPPVIFSRWCPKTGVSPGYGAIRVRREKDLRPYRRLTNGFYPLVMGAETKAGDRKGAIFILDFVDVPLPLATIRDRFARAGKWLTDFASAAEEDGEALRLQIGPTWAGGRMTREVEVTLGPARERGEALVVPIVWRVTGLTGIFPMLNGDLELAPLGSQRCRLTLAASYLPPFGDVGRALDHALLHRVAQSTVRSFLARVATSLEAGDATSADSTSL